VKQAEFVKSSVNVADCPPPKLPEFAVIGRSNVGKSSLINMLTNRKSLALVSKEPGEALAAFHWRSAVAQQLRQLTDMSCHCRQDALYKPLHHQQQLVPGGLAWLWVSAG
jgi:GTP-binding protein